mgnify:CR=1 FL=1
MCAFEHGSVTGGELAQLPWGQLVCSCWKVVQVASKGDRWRGRASGLGFQTAPRSAKTTRARSQEVFRAAWQSYLETTSAPEGNSTARRWEYLASDVRASVLLCDGPTRVILRLWMAQYSMRK